jgi:hypothetical protein
MFVRGQQILSSRLVFLRTNEHLKKSQTPRHGIVKERNGWYRRFSRNDDPMCLTTRHYRLASCTVLCAYYLLCTLNDVAYSEQIFI